MHDRDQSRRHLKAGPWVAHPAPVAILVFISVPLASVLRGVQINIGFPRPSDVNQTCILLPSALGNIKTHGAEVAALNGTVSDRRSICIPDSRTDGTISLSTQGQVVPTRKAYEESDLLLECPISLEPRCIIVMSQTAPGTFSGDYRGNFAGGLSSPVTPFFGRYGGVPTFNITNAIFTYNDISQLTGTFDTDAGAVIGPNNAEVSFTQSGTDYTFTISGVLQSVLNESYAISGWIEWIDTT